MRPPRLVRGRRQAMVRPLESGIFSSMFLGAAIPGVALAGGVVVVDQHGGGNFTQIQPAVAAAGDGDAILIKAGSYAGFATGDKSISVVADTGATVVVQGQVSVD